MRVTIDNRPIGYRICRWCDQRARWSIMRPNRYGWENLCHVHLGKALKNLGLTKLTIEHEITTTTSAEVKVNVHG